MPVRFRRAAPSAASIKVMHQALTLGNGDQYPGGALCGCDENLAHLAGSNPAVWEFESPHPHSMPGRLTAGLLTLDQAIEVRILAGQLTPPSTAAAPPSYGGWPGSAPGGGSIPGWVAGIPAGPWPTVGVLYRVQVKSATGRDATSGQWVCNLAQNPKFRKTVLYDPEDVDFFFIIDGDMNYFITPIEEVAGRGSVTLSTLRHRKVEK